MKTAIGTHFIAENHPELLKDESSLSGGNCQSAAWPENGNDSAAFLSECSEDRVSVTMSGARTGIAGGAVPLGGAVLSTERLKGIFKTGNPAVINVKAGETLDSVNEYCSVNLPDYYYPPDPTETTASVGGTIATDASGSSSYRYGSTRKWIDRISLVLNRGTQLEIKRGDYRFINGRMNHPVLGKLTLPALSAPQPAKNAAGLHIVPGMDLIDLFIGSEGELGLICDADLILRRKPYSVASLAVFCREDQFWALRSDLLRTSLPVRELEAMVPPCLDFLERNTGQAVHPSGEWVLITSIEVESEKEMDPVLEALDLLLEERGISPDSTWGGFDEQERKKLKDFRHLLPETVNRIIAGLASKNPAIHKVSTDTAVPTAELEEYYRFMDSILKETSLEHVVFGHCGQGHLHANLIPSSTEELRRAERAVELLAEKAVSLNGTVSAEHGTGKLKKSLLNIMYNQKELEGMKLLKESITGF